MSLKRWPRMLDIGQGNCRTSSMYSLAIWHAGKCSPANSAGLCKLPSAQIRMDRCFSLIPYHITWVLYSNCSCGPQSGLPRHTGQTVAASRLCENSVSKYKYWIDYSDTAISQKQFHHIELSLSILTAIFQWTWVSQCLLKKRMMEVVVTTGLLVL